METEGLLFQAFIYLFAAVISVPVAKRLGLGSVLGYLLAGVAIGPYVLRLVGHGGGGVMHVAEFGVVMMLFLVGLELRPNLLWRLRGPILGTGGLQVILTTLAITVLALFASMTIQQALCVVFEEGGNWILEIVQAGSELRIRSQGKQWRLRLWYRQPSSFASILRTR